MKNIFKSIVIVSVLNVLVSTSALAEELTKSEVKSQAIAACQTEAKKRYGEDSIEYIGKRAKWVKGMGGALVKIKVKPESKRATKFSCILQKDQQVKFYKV